MNKLVQMFIVIILISFVLMFSVSQLNSSEGYSSGNTLTVYNWGDYIDEELIAKFEKETGIKVIYETFDSNEAMFTKIQQGGTAYDIAVPSEYMIEKMKEENLLLPLDYASIPNIKHIDPGSWICRLTRKTNILCPIFGEQLVLSLILIC